MNDKIRHKLFHYSETPPPAAWNRIAEALDENPAYAQKLYDYEQKPAAGVWKKIDRQLTPPATKIISLRTTLFKYAIAAAVLIAVAAGSLFYFKHGTAPDLAHTAQKNASNTADTNSLADTQIQSGSKTTIAQYEDGASADNTNSNGMRTNHAMVQYARQVRIPKDQLTASELNVMPEEKTIIDTHLPDRYMIATTSNGKAVRLPKKAYSDYACAEAYQDYQCKERLAAIQSKMAASVATDFTDFIDLLKTLQDNQ